MKRKFILIFAGVAILLLMTGLLAGCQTSETTAVSANQQTGISVSGEGKVTVSPDIVNVQLGIQTQATTVADAQAQATKAMNDVISALTNNEVVRKDIQTQNYSIQQVTKWDNNTQEQVVTGYQINDIVNVKIRDINNAGAVIDAVTLVGGNLTRVNSIQFSVDDPTIYNDQARDKAMADAKDAATQLAKLSGVKLGKPISISENNIFVPQVVPVYAKDASAGASSTPISPGELDITMTVQVVYSIQ